MKEQKTLINHCLFFRIPNPWKKNRCQGKASINNNQQQMSVIINEEQIKGEQIIVIYTFVLDAKSLMMNYAFSHLRV
jgi:hypothetical protein